MPYGFESTATAIAAQNIPPMPGREDRRGQILRQVHERPGIPLSTLPPLLGVARRTVRHHVNVLARARLVRPFLYRGRLRLLPYTSEAPIDCALLALTDEPDYADLFQILAEGPQSHRAIAAELGCCRSRVTKMIHVIRAAARSNAPPLRTRERPGALSA